MTKQVILATVILFIGMALSAQETDQIKDENASGPGTYQILKDSDGPIIIPFKMHNGKPLMELEINGKKATMMIDNGVLWDEIWLFGSPLVEDLQLKPIEEGSIGGSGEGDPTMAYTSTNLILKFQDIVFYEQPVFVSPPAAGFSSMFPGADGQLCNTFFTHFIVEFDFVKNLVILHQPEHYKYNGKGSELEMKPSETGSYSVPFSFTMPNGKVFTENVDIDFGGIYPFKIALNSKINIQVPADCIETASYGAQGKSSEYSGKIKSMTFGKYQFDNPTVIFGDEGTSRIHPDNLGVIGLPLFMKFKITFDYFNNKMYIEPNENFSNSFD